MHLRSIDEMLSYPADCGVQAERVELFAATARLENMSNITYLQAHPSAILWPAHSCKLCAPFVNIKSRLPTLIFDFNQLHRRREA